MRLLLLAAIVLIGFSCKKDKTEEQPKKPEFIARCGTILETPVLDSFIYPTYYITTTVAFDDGNEVVHFHDKVTGDHDGSWFLTKYDKDTTYCKEPVRK